MKRKKANKLAYAFAIVGILMIPCTIADYLNPHKTMGDVEYDLVLILIMAVFTRAYWTEKKA